jgi:hypothetical protein
MSEPDFEYDLIDRKPEVTQTIYPRPVREILEEILGSMDKDNDWYFISVISDVVLPWINTQACANELQEKKIKDLPWVMEHPEVVPLITMLNTLRG